MNKYRFKFYLILAYECLFFPVLYLIEWGRNRKGKQLQHLYRHPVIDPCIYVGIHEWGGYPLIRKKKINGIKEFECGLKYQLQRFEDYKGNYPLDVTLTMSDVHLCKDLNLLKTRVKRLVSVSNAGMDFSGYKSFYEFVKNKDNAYVVLTNSSVNKLQVNFLDEYIQYMESNPDVGMLGISYNTKCYQSLIRNNFNPHIQSFFVLTTIDVLNEIVKLNHGIFPGAGVTYKLLLIREGEVKLSKLALKLGYALSVVTENGRIIKFDRYTNRDVFEQKGDMRRFIMNPNSINVIK